MRFWVEGAGFRNLVSFRGLCVGSRGLGFGCKVEGLGFRVHGPGFWVQGLGCRVLCRGFQQLWHHTQDGTLIATAMRLSPGAFIRDGYAALFVDQQAFAFFAKAALGLAYSSLIGCTWCIVKSIRPRSSIFSSPLWTP